MTKSEMETDNREQLRDQALCRSLFYGCMSLALHYPTVETFTRLLSEETRLALLEAASFIDAGAAAEDSKLEASPPRTGSIDIGNRVSDWIKTFQPLTLEMLLASQGRLFGHTARSVVCPYEAEYGQEALFQQPRQLSEITGFYRAFGLAPRATERERPDHVSCELEFLDFLSRKEAYALEAGDAPMLAETRKATRLFMKDHLGRFARAFGRLLREQDPEGFFGKLGELMYDFITLECGRLQVEAGPPLLRLRSAEDDNVPMACGEVSELVQLETPENPGN